MKGVLRCRSLRLNARKRLYEEIVVLTAVSSAETWNIDTEERTRSNVLEIKCLRNICGVAGMAGVRNEKEKKG